MAWDFETDPQYQAQYQAQYPAQLNPRWHEAKL
jgi:hypothetical protein